MLTDRVSFIFIELPRFNKSVEELDGNILEGMYFCFKNMAKLDERPKVLTHEIFKKIFEVSELYNMDEVTREKVIDKMTTERDLRNQMAYARQEAIDEGRAEGRAEAFCMAVMRMIDSGMSVEQVAGIMKMSVEQVRECLQDN